jgi:hypothetical protein
MPLLATAWGGFLEGGAGEVGLLSNWQVYGLDNQYRFFDRHVRPVLENAPRARVFVLISDAFRYEAAAELVDELNGKYRFKASVNAMLGVLPSYTALGMAALLPHQQLGYKPGGEVMVDGKPCAGIEQRGKILADYAGVAVKAEELLAMNKDAGREFVKPWRVVYVYHNVVDAVGDSASTESQTFSAVRTAIRELGAMVRFIVNSLNGTTVLVTADHGFLYQDSMLEAFDKSALDEKPAGAEALSDRCRPGREWQSLVRQYRYHRADGPRFGLLGAEGGEPFSLHRRCALQPRRRDAAGDSGAGGDGEGTGREGSGSDGDAQGGCVATGLVTQDRQQHAALRVHSERCGVRPGAGAHPAGFDTRG